MPQVTDEQLMLQVKHGDGQAFEVLYGRYRQPLFAFAMRLVREPAAAADVYQETFARLLQAAARYQAGRRVSTWVYTIAYRLCIDHLRTRRSRLPLGHLAPLLAGTAEDPAEAIMRRETETAAWAALEELPADQRAVVLLRVVHGHTQEETARIMGVSTGTVKSRLHYALAKLRQRLAT